MNHWKKIAGVEGLYINSNGIFYIRVTKPRNTFRSLRTKLLREAKSRIKSYEWEQNLKSTSYLKSRDLTFGEIVKTFIEERLTQLKVTDKTLEGIRNSLLVLRHQKNLWFEPLSGMDSRVIYKWIEDQPNRSNASKNYSVYAVRKLVEFAEDQKLIERGQITNIRSFSVCPRKLDLPSDREFESLVECLKYPHKERKKKPLPRGWSNLRASELSRRMGVSLSTAKRRIKEVRGDSKNRKIHRPEVAFTFLFLCYTGLRLGEARKLTWKDILDDRIIIRGTKTTSAFRFLPIYPNLANLLESMKEHRDAVKPEDKVLGRKRIDKALRRACERVGVSHLRHHDLRHYFATKAVQSGVDMPTIAKWLGHADGGVLAMKVYSNIMDEHSINQSAKLKLPQW
jgi:integrase